jgi:hypothetical protein
MPYKDTVKQREAQHRYYLENKRKYREASRKKNNLIRRKIIELKTGKKCKDCGIKYPYYVMDFDHIKGEKKFNIGNSVSNMTMKTFLEEVEKCEIVCSNCHRHRTYMRQSKNGDSATS